MNQWKDLVTDLLIEINQNLDEIKGRKGFAGESERDYIIAKQQAYREVVEMIKVLSKDYGLDEELGF